MLHLEGDFHEYYFLDSSAPNKGKGAFGKRETGFGGYLKWKTRVSWRRHLFS